VARQGRVATDPLGSVWLAGPIWIIGGGRSSTELTCRKTRTVEESTTLKAEHT